MGKKQNDIEKFKLAVNEIVFLKFKKDKALNNIEVKFILSKYKINNEIFYRFAKIEGPIDNGLFEMFSDKETLSDLEKLFLISAINAQAKYYELLISDLGKPGYFYSLNDIALNKIKIINNLKDLALSKGINTTDLKFAMEVQQRLFNKNINLTDCSNKNFENYNIEINLKTIKYFSSLGTLITCCENNGAYNNGDYYIHLENANLKGNKVVGDLNPFEFGGYKIKFYYSEDTFDEKYKKEHPEFFLSSDAPSELKEIYYCPYTVSEKENEEKIKERTLTFLDYIKYYEYLKGKSLINFVISKDDQIKIRLLNLFGLNETMLILNDLSKSFLPIKRTLVILNELSDSKLKLEFSTINEDVYKENSEYIENLNKNVYKLTNSRNLK